MRKGSHPVAGKVVLVTGASRGIGAETARLLARRGARVAAVGLEPDELERVAADCPGGIAVEADVSDGAAVAAAVERTVAELGGLDVVVANAGIGTFSFVRHANPDEWARTVDVNLMGTFRTVHAALPQLIERRGYVAMVSSVAAIVGAPGMSAYCASKAGVDALAAVLRVESAHLGVDVGIAYFRFVRTGMVGMVPGVGTDEEEAKRRPLQQVHTAEQAAATVVDGVERRATTMTLPGWIPALLAARGVVQPLLRRPLSRWATKHDT